MKKIVFVGSIKENSADFDILEQIYKECGCGVVRPGSFPGEIDFEDIVENYFDAIFESDGVIVISKPNLTFGDGTVYEMVFARFIGKAVAIITPNDIKRIAANPLVYGPFLGSPSPIRDLMDYMNRGCCIYHLNDEERKAIDRLDKHGIEWCILREDDLK